MLKAKENNEQNNNLRITEFARKSLRINRIFVPLHPHHFILLLFTQMSKNKKMRCASCGYETVVYEGRGLFRQEIIPMECLECHTVQNIVVGGIIGEVAPSFNSEAGRLCPKCSSMNIRRWNLHTCPRCGGEMVDTGETEFWT